MLLFQDTRTPVVLARLGITGISAAFNPGHHSTLAETLFPQPSESFSSCPLFLHPLPLSLQRRVGVLPPSARRPHLPHFKSAFPFVSGAEDMRPERGERARSESESKAFPGSLPDLAPRGTGPHEDGASPKLRGVRRHPQAE